VSDETLVLADVGQKAIDQLRASIKELLTRTQPPEKAEQMAGVLSTGTWTHDYPITVQQAQQLGIKASSDMPSEILDLMSLYPQPVRRQPSVEYLPFPRIPDTTRPVTPRRPQA